MITLVVSLIKRWSSKAVSKSFYGHFKELKECPVSHNMRGMWKYKIRMTFVLLMVIVSKFVLLSSSSEFFFPNNVVVIFYFKLHL